MKRDKLLDLTNGVCWSMVFSIAAIIMSVAALAHTHPRILYSSDGKTVGLGFDYIGVIVGILTLLVTFLTAWNIWKTIDSKNEIQRAIEETAKANKLANKCRHDIKLLRTQHLGFITHIQGEVEFLGGKYFDACLSFIDAAKNYIIAQNNVGLYVSVCLSKIELSLNNSQNDKSSWSKATIKDLIGRINNLDSLIESANSAQKFNKGNMAKIKSRLEEMLNSMTPSRD